LNLLRRSLEGRKVEVKRSFVDPIFGILDKNEIGIASLVLSLEDPPSLDADSPLENLSKKVVVEDCSEDDWEI
jgi:hypothetical protein